MIQLNFVNRTASNLAGTFGILPDRATELAKKLDLMVVNFTPTTGIRMVYMADVLERIQAFCVTDEEFIWCTVNHIEWMAKNGRMVPGI